MRTSKAYLFYWIWIPIALAIGLFFNAPIEIQFHDTFLITSRLELSVLGSVFLFISGLGYYIYKKEVVRKIEIIHAYLTGIGCVILIITDWLYLKEIDPSSEVMFKLNDIQDAINLLTMEVIGVFLVLTGFLLYLIHILRIGLKKLKTN